MVKVEINKSNKLSSNKSAFISFPYNSQIVEIMRSCKTKRWDAGNKLWEVSLDDFENIIPKLSKFGYNITDNTESIKSPQDSIDLSIIPSDYEFKLKPYKHQLEGVSYGLSHNKFLLADEQGLGKTNQSLNIATIKKKLLGYKHCLIIACVNSLKYNWYDEVYKHTGENAYILGTRVNKRGNKVIGTIRDRLEDLKSIGNNPEIDDSYFLITNIETLRMSETSTVPCKTKKNGIQRMKKVTTFPVVSTLQELIKNKEIQMIITDEIHKCFDGETKILTDDGYKPLNYIVSNMETNVASVNVNGDIEYKKPINRFIHKKVSCMFELSFTDGNNIFYVKCTPDHKFRTYNRGYIEAMYLNGSDSICCVGNNVSFLCRKIIPQYSDFVYDIEIPDNHNYIIEGGIVVHNCKDSTSLSGKALLSLNCESMIALTGTPLMNKPIDLYTTLKWLGYENHSLFAFKQHYCVMGGFGNHQVVGFKNLSDIQDTLQMCMLRRLKEDALDLPEKIYINDFVDMTKEQIKLYEEVLDNIKQNIDKIKLSPSPLGQLIRLRQITGNPSLLSTKVTKNPKLERLCEIVEDVVENGEKLIVFSSWTDVINPIYLKLKELGYCPALYTGENTKDRENERVRFKTDDKCKVICGTIGAMGTGLTLTEANTVVFMDEPWNRAIKDQAEDRCHRIGTTKNVNVITIMCRGTIDERINKLVYNKGKMADIIIDYEEDIKKNPNTLNYLLS